MTTSTKTTRATDRLTRCIANLQDPTVVDHNGERRVTFGIGDHYSTFPQIVVNQSGGVYTTARQVRDDLRAVGGSITIGYYRVSLATDGVHRGGADVLVDDLTVSTAARPADFAAARAAFLGLAA